MSTPVSVEECLADILGRLKPSPAYPHMLLESLDLAADREVLATTSIPPVDRAAVEGYAVRAIDTQGASSSTPVALAVARDVVARRPAGVSVAPGSCVRIAAGADIPAGADAVIALKDAVPGPREVRVGTAAYSGHLLRRAGDDVAKGDIVVGPGDVLGPRDIGLLAGLGVEQVSVVPRPRVVVISTGAEVHDANSYLLAATVRAAGAIAYRVQVPSDDPAVVAELLEDQLVRADLVVATSGNVDVVRAALRPGAEVRFREVAMRPAATLGYGTIGPERTPFFALPADPVAAYVAFTVFVAPALRRIGGRSPESRPLFRAKLAEDLGSQLGTCDYVCAEFVSDSQGARVLPVTPGSADMLGALGEANALIVLREDVAAAQAGDAVPIILLDRDY